MVRLALELVLAPALVGGSTLACRRWNERIGGLLSAFPAVIGPVLLIAAQERGVVFAARAANGTLLGLAALGAFAVTYGRTASRTGWWVSLVAAWACAALVGALAGWLAGGLGFPAGLGVAVISLALAYAAVPGRGAEATPSEWSGRRDWIAVRMVVTAALVAALATAAELVGPLTGGMLAALPVLASVLAVFTHRHDGPPAVIALLRGMLSGMAGFVGFCAVVALLIVPTGIAAAFSAATVAAVTLQALALRRQTQSRTRLPSGSRLSPVSRPAEMM